MQTSRMKNCREMLEDTNTDKVFQKDLSELQAHGILLRADAPLRHILWSYGTAEMITRLNECTASLAAFMFEKELHDNPDEKFTGPQAMPVGPLTFTSLAQDIALGHEAMFEIFSRSPYPGYPDQQQHHWLFATLLYQYAGDLPSAERMGCRRGHSIAQNESPSITQTVHLMLLKNSVDYIHALPVRVKHYRGDTPVKSMDALITLAEAASMMSTHREKYNTAACIQAIGDACTASVIFMSESKTIDAMGALCMAASFKAELLRLPSGVEENVKKLSLW